MATSENLSPQSVENAPVPRSESTHKLKPGAVGLIGVLFIAVANAAPITAMTGNTPSRSATATASAPRRASSSPPSCSRCSPIGFVSMARYVTTAGAFYGFITQGLGQVWGMASGALATMAYVVFEGSLIGIFAYFSNTALNTWFGWDINWLILARHRHRRHRHLRLLRHQHRRRHPRGDAHRGDPAAQCPRTVRAVQRRRPGRAGARGGQPVERVQVAASRRRRHRRRHRRKGSCRGQRRHRPVLRVLVLGRFRDDRGLRRRVAQPQAHRAQGDAHRRGRARSLLHVRVLDDDRGQRQEGVDRESPTPTRSACGPTWPTDKLGGALRRRTSTSSSS